MLFVNEIVAELLTYGCDDRDSEVKGPSERPLAAGSVGLGQEQDPLERVEVLVLQVVLFLHL